MTLKSRILPEKRRPLLKTLLQKEGFIRLIEVHNGLSAIVANEIKVELENGKMLEFDGLWESSFTDSASKGHPDAEIISVDSRLETILQILTVSNKPIIIDGDTGGSPTSFEYLVAKLERLGVSGIIIEDKVYPKRNSLDETADQLQEDPDVFAMKLRRGKQVLVSADFMIIARIESLIANKGVNDALTRAKIYLEAGVDGIMIHSKVKEPDEILNFAKGYDQLCKKLGYRKPLVSIPTTYNQIYEDALRKHGFNIVIHANHLLRASHKAMKRVARTILINQRSFETDGMISPVKEIFEDVGFLDVTSKDDQYLSKPVSVIIPAAGRPNEQFIKDFGEIPPSALSIMNKSLFQRQVERLRALGLKDINIITSVWNKEKIPKISAINMIVASKPTKSILESVFLAEEKMENGFICIYSDILFSEEILKRLLSEKRDIVLIGDPSFKSIPDHPYKLRDLMICNIDTYKQLRILDDFDNQIKLIKSDLDRVIATHEFIGISYFSKRGAEILKQVYWDLKKKQEQEGGESKAQGMKDIIQVLIDKGYSIGVLEVNKGWIELNSQHDFALSEEMIKWTQKFSTTP